jgi:hypothetical protein
LVEAVEAFTTTSHARVDAKGRPVCAPISLGAA